jgi:hypothetical protein
MTYAVVPDTSFSDAELDVIERGYRRDLQDLAAVRASYPSLHDVTVRDEREILGALARIDGLRRRKQLRQIVPQLLERIDTQIYA